MLTRLTPQSPDKILSLMADYRADDRPGKIDLGVGVYRNAEGVTPVMRAVKSAEARILEAQTTKAYTTLAGDPAYAAALGDLVLGDAAPRDRRAAVATPGGTGAFRQAMDLVRINAPGAKVWISRPTWPNHLSILKMLGLPVAEYTYFDPDTGHVDTDGMMADLEGVTEGDVIVVHGCCHNPTGANLTTDDAAALADLAKRRGANVVVDLAYQGFGDGLEADAQVTRTLARRLPELMIGVSCSKNFGIYRERTGLLIALCPDEGVRKLAQGNLEHLNRQNYSFPPDHGARIVTTILQDEVLAAEWRSELEDMRTGMLSLRRQLADALMQETNSDRFDFVADHRGMFSRLGLGAEEVERLKRDHAVYMVGDSRINIAGLNAESVPRLARAVAETIR